MALKIAPYMRPIVAQVNGRLSGMRAHLERERERESLRFSI